jgi:hypothetical protein
MKSGSLNLLEPSGPVQACNGIALPLLHIRIWQQWGVSRFHNRQLHPSHVKYLQQIMFQKIHQSVYLSQIFKLSQQCSWSRRPSGMQQHITAWLVPKGMKQPSILTFKHWNVNVKWIFQPLKIRPQCCLVTSGTNHSKTWCHIPQQRPLNVL